MKTNIIGSSVQSVQEAWRTLDADTQKQYGDEYFKRTQDRERIHQVARPPSMV